MSDFDSVDKVSAKLAGRKLCKQCAKGMEYWFKLSVLHRQPTRLTVLQNIRKVAT